MTNFHHRQGDFFRTNLLGQQATASVLVYLLQEVFVHIV